MSWRQRLSMLGVGKSPEEVDAEEERYAQDQKWVEVHAERLNLRQQLWRKKHEHGAERWKGRSTVLQEITRSWVEVFDRERLLRLVMLMGSLLLFAAAFSMMAFPLRWGWEYLTAPVPQMPENLENPVPRWYYVGYVKNLTQPYYKHWIVMDSSWWVDPDLSDYYMSHELAFDRMFELKELWPNAYVIESHTGCWQVFEPNEWGLDAQMSGCYPYYEDADSVRVQLEDRLKEAQGLPATDSLPSDPQFPAPEIEPPKTPQDLPNEGASPIAPVAEDLSAPPVPPSPSPNQ